MTQQFQDVMYSRFILKSGLRNFFSNCFTTIVVLLNRKLFICSVLVCVAQKNVSWVSSLALIYLCTLYGPAVSSLLKLVPCDKSKISSKCVNMIAFSIRDSVIYVAPPTSLLQIVVDTVTPPLNIYMLNESKKICGYASQF